MSNIRDRIGRQEGLYALAAQLLQGSNWSPTPQSTGAALGGGLQAYMGAKHSAQDRDLRSRLGEQQLAVGEAGLAKARSDMAALEAYRRAYGGGGAPPAAGAQQENRPLLARAMGFNQADVERAPMTMDEANAALPPPPTRQGGIRQGGLDPSQAYLMAADPGKFAEMQVKQNQPEQFTVNDGPDSHTFYGVKSRINTWQKIATAPRSTDTKNTMLRTLQRAFKDPAAASSQKYAEAYAYIARPEKSIDPQSGEVRYLSPDMGAYQPPTFRLPGGPAITGIPTATAIPGFSARPTEAQNKASGFADRLLQAEDVLSVFDTEGTDWWGNLMQKLPGGNYLQSAEYQQMDQAKRNFTNAVLRRESGAAISDKEFSNAEKQYFPLPGDSTEVIKQKRQNRKTALASMQRDAGPAYASPGGKKTGGMPDLDPTKVPVGTVLRNKKTGEHFVQKDGAWVKAQ